MKTTETNDQSALRLFVLPNRIADRASDRILGDYLCGMPVILSVRVVNVEAKKHRQAAVPVIVPGNWRERISLSVVDRDGVPIPALAPRPILEVAQDKLESIVEVRDNELSGFWLIDSTATAHLKGEYRIASVWKDAKSREIRLRFRESEGDEDRAKVLMGQAEEQLLCRHFGKASLLLEEVVKLRGDDFQDENRAVLLLLGDALSGANRPSEALKAYSKFLESWRKAGDPGRGEPQEVLWKISQLEKQVSSQTEKPTGANAPQ